MGLEETKQEIGNHRFKKAYRETISKETKADSKTRARFNIEKEVFDTGDSVADNAKMISLLITLTSRMYGIMSEESKGNLKPEERVMIEGIFSKFANITTRADLQFAQEGMSMVDKLLGRQEAVSQLLKK